MTYCDLMGRIFLLSPMMNDDDPDPSPVVLALFVTSVLSVNWKLVTYVVNNTLGNTIVTYPGMLI